MKEDNKLIRHIKLYQNRDAADKLINKYYDEIYRYVYRQCVDKNTSLDLVQEIFISVLRSINSFDPKKASFRTYLFRIATNKLIDERRKFTKIEVQFDELTLTEEIDIEGMLQNSSLLSAIEDYIREFAYELQQIFRLHVYANYTFKEIAEIQGLSEATVKTKYYRLIKKIKEEFSDEYHNANRE